MIHLHDIRYVRIGTNDMDHAVSFATRVLGLELGDRDAGGSYMRSDDRDHTLVYLPAPAHDHTVGFEVPDMAPKPSPARVKFRLDGPVPAVAEILASDKLSDISGALIDPNASKGTISAVVNLGLPIKRELTKADTTYTVTADLGGFAADRIVMNQKLESNALKIVANNAGYQVKGDVKINGQPASLDYRKPNDGDADIKVQATLDDASRARLGFDLGPAVSGAVPIKLIGKIGVERRLYTSGERKAMLDPFLPENPDDVERLKKLQGEIHQDFIALVKERRGAKLAGPENDLFSGEYWTGRRALELGLVDAIGNLRGVLRERFGDKVTTPLIVTERGFLGRRLFRSGFGATPPAGFAEDLISALEARAIWARYGL